MIATRQVLLISAIGIVLAACAATPKAPDIATAGARVAPTSALNAVRPGLYTAGQPAKNDWTSIAARGVGTVINLRPDAEMHGRDEAAEVRAAGMDYVSIAVADAGAIDADKAQRLSDVLKRADGAVLLHCASANRVGALLAVSSAQDGMPPADALLLGRKAGMTSTEPRVRELLGLPAAE